MQVVEVEQTPPEQVPPSQELPHVPQSVLDVWRSRQPSAQLVRLPHELPAVQTPFTHESELGQTKPQSPQLLVEVLRLTQTPLQLVSGLVQLLVVP